MSELSLEARVAILRGEADISVEQAEALLIAEDPIVRRQIDGVLESVKTRPRFEATIARHRHLFPGRRALT